MPLPYPEIPKYCCPLLAVEEVADLLRVSRRTALRALHSPPFSRHAFKRGRRWFIRARDFDRALAPRR